MAKLGLNLNANISWNLIRNVQCSRSLYGYFFIREITLVIADISFFDYFRYVSFQYNCRDYLHDFSWVINRVFLQQNLQTVLDGIITRYVWAFVWPLCLYKKAFDTVWHDGLWYKLLMCNIMGKMYHVILNLYNNIKSSIVYNDSVSNFFPCLSGVRQGENLYLFCSYYI